MPAVLAHRNRFLENGTYTDVGGTFAVTPPIQNLGTMQSPSPHAEFTGTGAEFSFAFLDELDVAETVPLRWLALLGHNLPADALIEWRRSDGTLIAAQSWRRYGNRAQNSHILLPNAVSVDTIHCKISNVASGTYRIGAAFAGAAWEFDINEGWAEDHRELGEVTSIDVVDWAFAAGRRQAQRISLPVVLASEAFGVPDVAGTVPVPDPWAVNNSTSSNGGVHTFTAVSGTLLSASPLVAATAYAVEVTMVQDPTNTGVVTCNVGGGGAQALQEGVNRIVDTTVDGTLVFATSGTFTGTLEVTLISELAEGLTVDDAKSRLAEIGNHNPVIYAPRADNQQWIATTALYGRVEKSQIRHVSGPYHTVDIELISMGGA